MADASDALRSALYASVFQGAAYVPPTAVLCELFTGATAGDEISEAGYEPQEVEAGDEDTPGAGTNTNVVTFGPIAGSGSATHFRLTDQSGNPLSVIKALAAPVPWTAGGFIVIAAGSLDMSVA